MARIALDHLVAGQFELRRALTVGHPDERDRGLAERPAGAAVLAGTIRREV